MCIRKTALTKKFTTDVSKTPVLIKPVVWIICIFFSGEGWWRENTMILAKGGRERNI